MSFTRICGTDERSFWLAARRTGVGASDAPSLFGLGYRSALEVYQEKISDEDPEDSEESELTKWGRKLEPLIIDAFAEETGRLVEHGGQLLRSREWPWMLATLDAEQTFTPKTAPKGFKATGPGTLECKNTHWLAGEWEDNRIPRRVWIQQQQQLAVTGREWGSVAVLLHGSKFVWADVQRDDEFIRTVLVPAGNEFWKRVQARRPVAPDGTESAKNALKKLWPDAIPGKAVNLGGELIEFDDELQQLEKDIKAMEKRRDQIKQSFIAAIGDAESGMLANGVTYSHKTQTRAEYLAKATTFRVLRRHGPKGK